MANLTAAYARMRAEENQPDPEDFDTYEEYEAEASAYWERFEGREAMYYDDMVDAARDAAFG